MSTCLNLLLHPTMGAEFHGLLVPTKTDIQCELQVYCLL